MKDVFSVITANDTEKGSLFIGYWEQDRWESYGRIPDSIRRQPNRILEPIEYFGNGNQGGK